MDIKNIKKILVIKLCCIGDIIQTTPAIKALASKGAEIHFLCIKWVEDIIDMIPEIKEKHIINMKNIADVIKVIFKLRKEKFDLIVNFHRDTKSYFFAAALGSMYRAGFNWKGQGKFLTHPFPFDEKGHESLRYLSIAEGLGFDRKTELTSIQTPEFSNSPVKITGKIKVGFFPGGGKNPGTTMPTKRWPVENFVKLAGMLEKKGVSVYFFGGEIDSDVLDNVRLADKKAMLVITKNLKELAYQISATDIFIAGDTGPLHMAAALGVKTIGLFGPSDPSLVGPLGTKNINLSGKPECAPCYEPGTVHYGKFLDCNDNICMKKITPIEVMNAVDKLL